jgi:large subunit ribosomal protein L25
MAHITDLSATLRTELGNGFVRRLRTSGFVPGVVYGKKKENLNVKVDSRTFGKILKGSESDNILVNLQIDGAAQLALVQEVQHDHLKGGILHVDFHAIDANEEIHASVPLHTVGEAIGIKFGGLLELLHHDIEVRCLPKDLPDFIEVDVTSLAVGQATHAGELKLPAGVRVTLDADVVLALISESKVVEETPAAAADAAASKKGAAKSAAKAPAAKAPAAKAAKK